MNPIFRPWWSRQHGAYITLITAWLASAIASNHFHWLQVPILVMLLSGFNFSELAAESFKRKTPLPDNKKFWMLVYLAFLIATGSVTLWFHPFLKFFVPVFGVGLVLFTLLSLRRMQKTTFFEMIIFALFSLAGLMAYLPSNTLESPTMTRLFLYLWLYFCVSVFTVKVRLKKLPAYASFFYGVISIILLLLFGRGTIAIIISVLIGVKAFPIALYPEKYDDLKIQTVGIMESFSHLAFILIIAVYSESL